LAGTRLTSSRLGFGLSGLHHLLRSRDRQNLLSAALHSGINYFDTSPYYGHGLAERELGVFARGHRGRIVIATKFGIQPNPWSSRFPIIMYSRLAANAALRRLTKRRDHFIRVSRDYSSGNAVASLDRSLKALRADHVDILYLHDPTLDRLTEPDRLFDTLHRLQRSGKVRYFGLAGDVRECLAILRQPRAADCLLQVNAAPGEQELGLLHAASIPFHSSFGHFRGKHRALSDSLAAAVGANADGVILFSTRRASHIGSMVELLANLETP
jgi:aryl-alcohol dehydrogenase-like predicted oxidoreductase